MIDGKTLSKWRAMATEATPGLTHDACRTSRCYYLIDDETTFGMADGFDATAKANARFWAASRAIVLTLVGEIERLREKDQRHDDYMHGYRDAAKEADDFCANCDSCSSIQAELLHALDAKEEGLV